MTKPNIQVIALQQRIRKLEKLLEETHKRITCLCDECQAHKDHIQNYLVKEVSNDRRKS